MILLYAIAGNVGYMLAGYAGFGLLIGGVWWMIDRLRRTPDPVESLRQKAQGLSDWMHEDQRFRERLAQGLDTREREVRDV